MAAKLPETSAAKRGRWFKRRDPLTPVPAEPEIVGKRSAFRRLSAAARRRYSKTDVVLFASGIALSAVCAFFPWYVFFNQQQFGVRAVKMDMPSSGTVSTGVGPAGRNIGPLPELARDANGLDSFTTGTLADPAPEEDEADAEAIQQPFPVPVPEFELVHVANGRAMIQDDMGLFVVQRGSLLPDNSKVTSIEQRNGRWVVVTSADRVLEITAK
jgi:hypothetical protein